jgi:hypothetical protein
MTLDQIYLLICDKKILRGGSERTAKMAPVDAFRNSKDGTMRGRTADGTPFTARHGGKSLAAKLIEQQTKQVECVPKAERRRRARGG